jgi:DNA-binding PadR family transcriptional regulator
MIDCSLQFNSSNQNRSIMKYLNNRPHYHLFMTEIFNIAGEGEKSRGILTFYVLHSLKEKPKSGYEILAEIKTKTQGTWTPSKGTLYPLLKSLETEGLIKLSRVEKRSKNIYRLTVKGRRVLFVIRDKRKEVNEKIFQFRNLFGEIITEENVNITALIFEIRLASLAADKTKKEEVIAVLGECLSKLKKIGSSISRKSLKTKTLDTQTT